MKAACINCGERPATKGSSLCEECRKGFEASAEPQPLEEDCGRAKPWPSCRCQACVVELDKVFRASAELQQRMQAKGRRVLDFPAEPPKWRSQIGENGKVRLVHEFTVDEMTMMEQASMLAGLKRKDWMRRAIRRQAWLELQGEAALVKRIDDLTTAVAALMRRVEELDAQSIRDRIPRPR